MGRPKRLITQAERRAILRLAAKGASYRDIVAELHESMRVVRVVLRPLGGVIRHEWFADPSGFRLSCDERQEIWLGLKSGESFRAIARRLGRAPSSISREVEANGGRDSHHPRVGEHRARRCASRPKERKLEASEELWRRVRGDLERLWSPQQIAARLRAEFGDYRTMTVSHETIYKSIYVQGRGELRRELARCLRSGRAVRRPQSRMERRGTMPGMVMISERPAEVADRAVPGHWEGDLILGKQNESAIGTLVERSTRFVMLVHLPKDHSAEAVRRALMRKVTTLPKALRRSITWDQGSEMAQHRQFTVDTGVQIYFCDPRSPWQRGSNENTVSV